jgi:hypothetical protein
LALISAGAMPAVVALFIVTRERRVPPADRVKKAGP